MALPATEVHASELVRLDSETITLGGHMRDLLKLLLDWAEKRQAVDAEYAPQVTLAIARIKQQFDVVHGLADALRPVIVKRGSKSAKRIAGAHQWRKVTRVNVEGDDESIIEAIRALKTKRFRKFLRYARRWELDRNAFRSESNAALLQELLSSLPPEVAARLLLDAAEDYLVTPASVFTLSSASELFNLDGVPVPENLRLSLGDGS